MERYAPYGDMKIFYHTDRVADFIAGRRCPPVYVRIKPTNRCNQNCAYCGFQHAENGWKDLEFDNRVMIPWDRLERTLLEMKDMDGTGRGVKAVTFSGGGTPSRTRT